MSESALFFGVYPLLATPLTTNDQVDEDRLASLVEDLITNGRVNGVIPLGSTGEFALLSMAERMRVAEVSVSAAKKRVPVVVGTAAIATRDAVELSKHAQRIGADAIIVNPQSYWKPTEDELFEHYRAIARAVDIPVMVYNNPGTTKVDMSPTFIARLFHEFSHFTAVKESTGDVRRVQNILQLTDGKMCVSIGHQSLGLAAFAIGATSWTTGMANTIPQQCGAIFQAAVVEHDFVKARPLFEKILPLCDFYAAKSLTRGVKTAAELMGKPLGSPRLPLRLLNDTDRADLKKILASLGLLEA